jgi:predicted AlkP superfamily phosphohydrolase/phosphomutase
MKILVIGLDCAAPELLFGDERLTNIRALMASGFYGRLESVVPPITVPAWMCMSTSQDPGSLGVYGFRNRSAYGYDDLTIANSKSIREIALWDQVAREGRRSVIVGVPPGYPPRKVNGISVGCFLTPDPSTTVYTHPASVADEIARLVGEYPVDVKNFRTERKDWLRDEIYAMTRKHFEVIRHFLQSGEWDYLQFVEIGLDRLHHGFWKYHDPQHRRHVAGNPYESVIRDYYCYLDHEIGRCLELLDDDTVVAVVSDHGAQRLDGGFCVNEWLIRQGLLVLNNYPTEVTPFGRLSVDWSKTTAWSEGGYYARVFLNVKGREPHGTIEQRDYEKVRDDLTARLEATEDDLDRPLGTVVFKPDRLYKSVRNIAPDLIVHFGGLYWRSIGGVGYPTIHVEENDTGPDDCNHAQFGSVVIAAPNGAAVGEIEGMHLLDVAPTLLEVAGYDIPSSMQGRSLASLPTSSRDAASHSDEEIIHRRLSGLGYI